MGRRPIWTDDQCKLARKMLAEGHRYADIAPHIGKTREAVASYFQYHNKSEEQRERRREMTNARSRGDYETDPETPWGRPSAEMLAERDRCFALVPRDLTAALLGDPLVGRSARERGA